MSRIRVGIAGILLLLTTSVVDAKPRISGPDARKVALAKVPGTVMHEKLKHKKHGHDLYYFKIKPKDAQKSAMWKKVEIDADTGAVVKIKDTKPKGGDADKDD